MLFFDEIGMAELNSKNPLKVLHKLLDRNVHCEDENHAGMRLFDKNNFSFISISNWKLDLSKMSRSVYITRPDLVQEDLEDTARDLMMLSFKNHQREAPAQMEQDEHFQEIQKQIDFQSTLISEGYLFLRRNKNHLVDKKRS